MQEIEVPPRDVFQHYVHVDQPDKTLVWWFSTKKKNISFGLFFRKSAACPPQLRSNTLAPSISSASPPSSVAPLASSPTSTRPESISSRRTAGGHGQSYSNGSGILDGSAILSTSPTKSCHASNYASSRASVDSLSDDDDDHSHHTHPNDNSSSGQNPAISRPVVRRKKTVAKFKDPELIEILPIEHYDSSSGTIRGEYTIKEEGSYVLVFDNSFSINTSKRLTFFVALEARGRKASIQPKTDMAGWLLKKKRKRMQ
ncbi:hypothetical protein BGW38_004513, partial [Lunasporangiospora selenospora]